MPSYSSTRPGKFASAWLVAWLTATAACLAGWSPFRSLARPAHAPTLTTVSSERGHGRGFRPIEQIKVGDRVATNVPSEVWQTDFVSLDEDAAAGPDVDPSSWRLIRMYGETKVGAEVLDDHRIDTLQHINWLKHHHVQIGAACPVPLDLEEMESDPDLQVTATAILPCPRIKHGKGRIVMTTVNHFNVDVWKLVVEDESGRRETIKPTGKHRFYSATRKTGVATQDLEPGEYLLGDAGPITVVSLQRDPGKQRVYNMTVQGEHVYRVSLLGVLTHNNYDISGHNPPINQARQALHTSGIPGKSQFNPGVDVEGVVRMAWERGVPQFDSNGKFIGKVADFSTPVGTSATGVPVNNVKVHWSPNKGIHGHPTGAPPG